MMLSVPGLSLPGWLRNAKRSTSAQMLTTCWISLIFGPSPVTAAEDWEYGALKATFRIGGALGATAAEETAQGRLCRLCCVRMLVLLGARSLAALDAQVGKRSGVGPGDVVLAGLVRHHEADVLRLVRLARGDGRDDVRAKFDAYDVREVDALKGGDLVEVPIEAAEVQSGVGQEKDNLFEGKRSQIVGCVRAEENPAAHELFALV